MKPGHEPGCLLNEKDPHHEDTCTCSGVPFGPVLSATVQLPCDNYRLVPMESVKVLEVQENIFGEDIATFECPDCRFGKTHESKVLT